MKILINTSLQRFGGGVQVALSLIYECRKIEENTYYVWVGPGVRQSLNESDFPSNFYFLHFDFGLITLLKSISINRRLRKAERIIKPDVIITTSGPSYFRSVAPQIIGYNNFLYIYPESPYFKELSFYRRIRHQIKKRLHFYFFSRDATAFIVQTEDVNMRLRNALKTSHVFTVSNTYSSFYENFSLEKKILPARNHDEVRLLTLSSYYPHKNLEIIPCVLKELRLRGYQNVCFVTTLKQGDYELRIGEDKFGGIINIGPQNPMNCPALYADSDFMFLPTLAECFSASYPEAMVMGKPIVTTDLSFARSICGDAALYYRPMDAAHAADQIVKLINDKSLQNQLIENGYKQLKTFDVAAKRAEKYLAICEKVFLESKKLK